MTVTRVTMLLALACGITLASTTAARAVSPRNPYRSFNLSGLNYGSMQWEKAQRQGKRVWPSSNTPTRTTRGDNVSVGGFGGAGGGAVIQSGSSRSSRRGLFRRR